MRLFNSFLGLVLLLTSTIPVPAFALQQDGVSIAVLDLPHLFQPDKQGFYDKLFAEMQKAGIVKSWQIVPPNRSSRMMMAGEVDCKAPLSLNVSKKLGFEEGSIVFSKPFNYTLGHIVSPKDHPALKDRSLLKGKSVGTVKMGKIYGVPEEMLFEPVAYRSYDTLVEAIERGHVEFGYFISPDLHFSDRGRMFFTKHKKNSFVIWRGIESIACNKQHAASIPKMNAVINRFIENNKSNAYLSATLPQHDLSQP